MIFSLFDPRVRAFNFSYEKNSLVAHRGKRAQLHGSACRNITGNEGNKKQQSPDNDEGKRIARCDARQHGTHEPSHDQRSKDPGQHTPRGQKHSLRQNHPEDLLRVLKDSAFSI